MVNKYLVSNLNKAQSIAAAGMHAQTMRIRVVSENVSNAESTSLTPGGDPYRRKTIEFGAKLDPDTGTHIITVKKIGRDPSAFHKIYKPTDPGADKDGFLKRTNVNSLLEMMDLREASRSHEANLSVYNAATAMLIRTVESLKGRS